MKVLVFGKTGQVAMELQSFDGVTCLSREEADLTNPEHCANLITQTDANVVINAAAYTAVDAAETDEDVAAIINGSAVGAMAEAASKRNLPFLHVSTDYVFDGKGTRPWRPNDPVAPLGAYGRTKLIGEKAVEKAGGDYCILRTSWVYSAHGNNFVKTMLRLGAERAALSIVDDQIGGPTAAADIANALMSIARSFNSGNGTSGIYHYSGQPAVSWAGFAAEIFEQAGLTVDITPVPSSEYPTPAKRPNNSRMDCSDIKTSFDIDAPNWKQSLSLVLNDLNQ